MKKYIIIKADTNDGDYVYSKNEVKDEQLELFRIVAKAVKSSPQRHNWNTSEHRHGNEKSPEDLYKDILTDEQIGVFGDYCPSGEYGIHTIKSIELLTIANEEKLL